MSHNHYITDGPGRQEKKSKMSPEWQAISDGVASPLVKRVTYYKYQNRRIVAALSAIGEKEKAAAVHGCGTFIKTSIRNGHEVITESNFCRQRLCQICAWRRSARFTAQMIPVLRVLSGKGYKWIFVTLTMKNPTMDNVSPAVTALLSAWDRLLKRSMFKRVVLGYCRSVEITYNISDNTYHPHIHALICVPTNYGPASKDYISHSLLKSVWQEVLKVDYEPWVDIRLVRKERSRKATTAGAAIETIKYAYKIRYDHISADTVATLLYSLRGRRLISFGGVVEETRRQLQQGDIDDNLNDSATETAPAVLYLFSPAGWRVIEEGEI